MSLGMTMEKDKAGNKGKCADEKMELATGITNKVLVMSLSKSGKGRCDAKEEERVDERFVRFRFVRVDNVEEHSGMLKRGGVLSGGNSNSNKTIKREERFRRERKRYLDEDRLIRSETTTRTCATVQIYLGAARTDSDRQPDRQTESRPGQDRPDRPEGRKTRKDRPGPRLRIQNRRTAQIDQEPPPRQTRHRQTDRRPRPGLRQSRQTDRSDQTDQQTEARQNRTPSELIPESTVQDSSRQNIRREYVLGPSDRQTGEGICF
ncbi:hypothetical protein Tco_1200949 [Tanacetum coccineum]